MSRLACVEGVEGEDEGVSEHAWRDGVERAAVA